MPVSTSTVLRAAVRPVPGSSLHQTFLLPAFPGSQSLSQGMLENLVMMNSSVEICSSGSALALFLADPAGSGATRSEEGLPLPLHFLS